MNKINKSTNIEKSAKANMQITHLVFADTQANIEKPKEIFFSQCLNENL
jgi:hypothetical protein